VTGTTAQQRLDEEPRQPVTAVIALGSNLGDRHATLQSAIEALAAFEGLVVQATSPVFETSPVGGPPEQRQYLNAVVLARTRLSPLGLLHACQSVETEHGRQRAVRWGPRTLDVDIVAYGDLVAAGADLEVPHPRAHERPFVLAPWLAADPAGVLPSAQGARPVAELLEELSSSRRNGDGARPVEVVRERADLTLRVPS
jgi:dihydroneopterin aldolase/2-amino-4-hydroxy-6-hydroxymethyldihydropteridine diphosphokinase